MDRTLAQKVNTQIKSYEGYIRLILDEKEEIKRKIMALKIYRGRLEGKSFQEIGEEIGVSKQRAHQILEQYFKGMLEKNKK